VVWYKSLKSFFESGLVEKHHRYKYIDGVFVGL